ncbi:MAG: phage baseplate protein [Leptolyngbyaceae cyanobacterium SU_3_3]|nr:phage baseplate protein [Leptolyngbyaceae cyanobacterium SU_3_3]NJR49161.1 phage baseplate protein [Leptolyngbyaceae cyanobacterium CSU_1_3]
MRSLSAQQIVRVWEIGQGQHFLDRALTLLTVACPEQSATALASLSVGQRDAYLLRLRELTFGDKFTSVAPCPHCGERLESNLNVSDFRIVDLQPPPPLEQSPEYQCRIAEFELRFRLPNSWDLAAIVGQRNVMQAKSLLEQRCLLEASLNGRSLTYDQLPVEVIQQLGMQLTECDPQAEILLNFKCPACEHTWNLLFDIVTFFWTELTAQAKRLVREVHMLARFYGWREADILAMTTARRQLYLSLCT